MHVVGFNPKGMTDQELADKTTEIHKRLAYSGRFSLDGYLVEQLSNMAEACAFEARERIVQRQYDEMNKSKSTEKDLTPDPKAKMAKTNGGKNDASAKRESGFRVSRSKSPSRS